MSLTGDPLFIAAEVEYRYGGPQPAGARPRREAPALPAALGRMLRVGAGRPRAAGHRPGFAG